MKSSAPVADPVGAVAAYLELTGAGDGVPSVFSLQDEVVIGRDAQDSLASGRFLRIPDDTVSRRHARIRRRGDTFFVEDLHSANGTFVSGKPIRPGVWHPLRDGEELAVCSAQIVFHSLVVPARESMPSIITMAVDATQLTRAVDATAAATQGDVQRILRKLHAMAQVSIALGVVTDRETLFEKLMNFVFDLFPLAERAFILMKGNEGEEPVPVAARRRDSAIEELQQFKISRTIVDEVLTKKQSILSVDTLSDRHFATHESIVSQAIRSVMCAPLILEGEVLGMIQVDTSSDPYAFNGQDLELLTGVCAATAVTLKSFQLYSDIAGLLDGFVRASVQAIEERDPSTAGHSFRVASYAEQLAKALGQTDGSGMPRIVFSNDQLREIRYAALLHDFGKVGVREHVLRKEKKLHHSDMRLLEHRFKHVRACLERKAYRHLAEMHAQQELSIAAFRLEKCRIEEELREEFGRLEAFLAVIRSANEPAVSLEQPLDLGEAIRYTYPDVDDAELPLLSEAELSALRVQKGCLTADERRQIELHVADSYSFLILIPWTRDLAGVPAIAHGHHEKLDGSGYPMGLRGNQISVQTRILTICDIYDALTAGDRPYKTAVPAELALDLMAAECRAGRIDSALFKVFVASRVWRTS